MDKNSLVYRQPCDSEAKHARLGVMSGFVTFQVKGDCVKLKKDVPFLHEFGWCFPDEFLYMCVIYVIT